MHETWRWWLRGVVTYPQRSTPDQPFSPMQDMTLKLILLDGLLCHWLCRAVLFKPEPENPPASKPAQPAQEPSPLPPPRVATSTLPLQGDLFRGTWVDNRTQSQKKAEQERTQPSQMTLFRQREIAQFGVRAHPQMSLSPHTKLVLIAEDPRSDEEKERDTQRAAEALTVPLFPDFPPADEEESFAASSVEPPPLLEIPAEPLETTEDLQTARLAIYLRLVQLAEEQESMAEQYPEGFASHVALTILDAHDYGLQRAEIQAAMLIGHARKRQLQAQQEVEYTELLLDDDEDEPIADLPGAPQQLGLTLGQEKPSKLQTYLRLIHTVETHTRMGLSSTREKHPHSEPLARAQAAKAAKAGLTGGEITAALAIAAYRAGLRPKTRPLA